MKALLITPHGEMSQGDSQGRGGMPGEKKARERITAGDCEICRSEKAFKFGNADKSKPSG